MSIYFYLAFKSLLCSRLSLTLLLLAIAAGVALQIPNAANIQGYTDELFRQGVARATGHVIVQSPDTEPLAGVEAHKKSLTSLGFVRALTERVEHAGVVFKGEKYQATRVVGLVPAAEDRAYRFCAQLERGSCAAAGRPGHALVGQALAKRLAIAVDDRIKVTLPYQDLGEIAHATEALHVVGIMAGTGGFQADHDLYLPLAQLKKVLGLGDEASRLSIFVDDHRQAERYVAAIAARVAGAKVTSWWRENTFVANAIEGNRTLSLISLTMVLFAVAIPVLALLYIHVLHERRPIATLAALGFSRGDLFFIYLCQAALVGVLGVAAGGALGLGLCSYFAAHPIFSFSGFTILPQLSAPVVLLPAAILFLVTLVAGFAPALKASRADPASELREG